ncbi:AAA family ATPase [Pseudescherichia sp. L3]|uniref:AAA family ATPase n=1 Tax=Pseudescherichia sp. L3 TaxID=2970817 RepID=UPI00214F85AC|nr:AAA family ATPase [Pseudescherichia sp. L3]MCR4458599.1 AAA family ATPase [Pseudescherichia sp. L3]
MAIAGCDFTTFATKLNEVLTLSVPVRTPEKLFGREKQLETIQLALHSPGRHVFIYGDRGVGKTSLAHTAASLIQSSDNRPITVSCDHDSTLESVIESVISQAILRMPMEQYKTSTTFGVNIPIVKAEARFDKVNTSRIRPVINMASAVEALNYLTESYSKKTVVVIDEFDLIRSEEQRSRFGVLLKQLSDGDVPVRIIFTGIGQSLSDLIGGHLSSQRQIEQIDLDRLHWTGRKRIVDSAFEYFGVDIPAEIADRICALSDGFPYYVHLMCSKLLHECYMADEVVGTVTRELFLASLDASVLSAEETLRSCYEAATCRDEHMHHILWAMAEGADLNRMKDHIITSYIQVMKHLSIEPLTQKNFDSRFARLRKENHGSILCHALVGKDGVRPGWFRFRENMIRGFVRMQAEKCGIVLDFDRQYSAHTASIRTAAVKGVYSPLSPVERSVARLRRDDEKDAEEANDM